MVTVLGMGIDKKGVLGDFGVIGENGRRMHWYWRLWILKQEKRFSSVYPETRWSMWMCIPRAAIL
jgi:hypothetical protein